MKSKIQRNLIVATPERLVLTEWEGRFIVFGETNNPAMREVVNELYQDNATGYVTIQVWPELQPGIIGVADNPEALIVGEEYNKELQKSASKDPIGCQFPNLN